MLVRPRRRRIRHHLRLTCEYRLRTAMARSLSDRIFVSVTSTCDSLVVNSPSSAQVKSHRVGGSVLTRTEKGLLLRSAVGL